MKILANYIVLMVFVLVIFSVEQVTGQDINSDSCTSVATKKILLLKTPWSESENAASLAYFDCKKRIGSAYAYNNFSKGEFHRYQEGNSLRQTGFFTDGFVTMDQWKFYGKFNYFNEKEKSVNWVQVLHPYNDNPYIMADSIGGDYSKEYFNMEGKASLEINDLLTAGVDVKYLAGVGAKRKDPRPRNTTTSFDISPGIIADFNKLKLGAGFRYVTEKEDISVSTVTDKNFNIFHFKGMGVFSSTTEFDERSSESNLLGGNIQAAYFGENFDNLTEVRFYKKSTDIKRGKTYPLQVVLLEKFNTNVTSTFVFNTPGHTLKKLKLFFNDTRLYGHEPVVEPKLEQVSYQWSTVAKYTLYWLTENTYGAEYSLYKLIDEHHFDWGAVISAQLKNSETSYYFVPEYNRQTLNMYDLKATLEKEIRFNSGDLIFTAETAYRNSFDSSLEIIEEESLLKTVNTELINHDFDFYNSGLWQVGASARIGKNISIYQSPMQVFLDVGYRRMLSELPGKPTWENLSIKIGMNF